MSCAGKIFWGCMFILFMACFIYFISWMIILIFGAILIVGISSIFKRKKTINVSARGTGTVDENGKVTDYKLQGFDIVKNEKSKKTKNE